MSELNIAFIGECMVEMQNTEAGWRQGFAGDTLNTATYLSRLLRYAPASISYVTGVGKDQLSQAMVAGWQCEGIDTSLVKPLEEKLPGLYMIEVDDSGERSFHYWREDSAAKYWLDVISAAEQERLSRFDVIYLSGISLAILSGDRRLQLLDLLTKFTDNGGQLIFDNNYRPRLWPEKAVAIDAYARVLALTHTALLTFDDEQAIYGDSHIDECIARSLKFGIKEIVIKRGSKDCVVVNASRPTERISVAATPVAKVVDTCAAGDSFAAGYLSKRLRGKSIKDAIKTGHRIASTVIQHKGAIIAAKHMPILDL